MFNITGRSNFSPFLNNYALNVPQISRVTAVSLNLDKSSGCFITPRLRMRESDILVLIVIRPEGLAGNVKSF